MSRGFGLVVVAPDLAAGRFLMPRVVGVAHLFTLGWLTTSIIGVIYQLLPVLIGSEIRWRPLAWLSGALYVPGLAVFVTSLGLQRPEYTIARAALFASGLLLFIVNVIATLIPIRQRDLSWWTLTAAILFLLVTIVFGASRAINVSTGHLAPNRLSAIGVHMHVALAGWIMLVMVAAGRRLLPMFLLSHGTAEAGWRAAAALLGTGAGLLALLHGILSPLVVRLAALLLGAGTATLIYTAARQFQKRQRPQLDAGLRLAAGIALLAASLLLAIVGFTSLRGSRILTAYGTAVVPGAFTLFVMGHYYKTVPFLTWNRIYGGLAGRGHTPQVSELFRAGRAAWAVRFTVAGACGLIIAILFGYGAVARGAALIYASGIAMEAAQLGRLLVKGRKYES